MSRLIVTYGLPGSGKTTKARAWVAENPGHRARVNRDDLRAMAHASVYLGRETEDQICAVVNASIAALLRHGVDVPIEVCIARDAARTDRTVGREVIETMWQRWFMAAER